MALTPTTELEAVNTLLGAINEAPINSLSGALPVDASQARSTLAEVSRDVQTRGWTWNTERMTLVRNGSNQIGIPTNALRVLPSESDAREEIVVRGGKLYNKAFGKNTFTFDEDIDVEIISLLSFTDLPEAARRYVTLAAARVFQERQLADPELSKFDRSDEQRAYALLRQEETDTSKYNMGTGSITVQRVINRRTVWR
jgi:hypothetical protein